MSNHHRHHIEIQYRIYYVQRNKRGRERMYRTLKQLVVRKISKIKKLWRWEIHDVRNLFLRIIVKKHLGVHTFPCYLHFDTSRDWVRGKFEDYDSVWYQDFHVDMWTELGYHRRDIMEAIEHWNSHWVLNNYNLKVNTHFYKKVKIRHIIKKFLKQTIILLIKSFLRLSKFWQFSCKIRRKFADIMFLIQKSFLG